MCTSCSFSFTASIHLELEDSCSELRIDGRKHCCLTWLQNMSPHSAGRSFTVVHSTLRTVVRSISEISSCFLGPRPWHIEIRHRVKKTSTINLFGFEALKWKIRRLKLRKPTIVVHIAGCLGLRRLHERHRQRQRRGLKRRSLYNDGNNDDNINDDKMIITVTFIYVILLCY